MVPPERDSQSSKQKQLDKVSLYSKQATPKMLQDVAGITHHLCKLCCWDFCNMKNSQVSRQRPSLPCRECLPCWVTSAIADFNLPDFTLACLWKLNRTTWPKGKWDILEALLEMQLASDEKQQHLNNPSLWPIRSYTTLQAWAMKWELKTSHRIYGQIRQSNEQQCH